MIVLGIETSCDETAVAVYSSDQGLLADVVYSQVALHAEYGGVVPELASRDHMLKLLPLVQEVLQKSKLTLSDLSAIAYTAGPGLVGALLVGVALAKSLSYALGIPSLGIHHMEGHLLAPMLADEKPEYPFLCLLVSGGHTMLVVVQSEGHYRLLGESIDDAAGEAFDKTAKLLGLPYPGGPFLARLAESGDDKRFRFPRPMTDRPGFDFSFSGLKTSVLQTVKTWKGEIDEKARADIAASFQAAVVDTLIIKSKRALKETGLNRLVVAGGVSANLLLRKKLASELESMEVKVYFPPLSYCTDNAAMIAYAGCQRLLRGEKDENNSIVAKPRWSL